MFARVRESISSRAANRVRPLRRRLKAGVAPHGSETQSHSDDHSSMDPHHRHHRHGDNDDHLDNASVHSTITVETTRTATNENRKPTANPNLRPHTQVFCGLSEDPSLEPTEVLERAQSDITKLAVYMQQIQLTRPVTSAFMGLVRGDNRTWEAIAVDILRQKARWENITLEDCEGEYLDTILAFLFHLDNCAFLHLSNLLLSANGAWTLQSIVFCKNLSKLQLDLIDLSFAMPMLCRGLRSNMSLKCLIASRCGLNDDRLHELFTSLPKQLQELRIFGNKCREKGLAAITNVVHHSQHLRILDMSYQHVDPNNPDDGEFDVSWLAGALHHNRVLKVLDLDNDGIDDGHLTHLCAALCANDTLEELMLNHNRITATGITLLSSKFGEMKGLKKISMYSNLFDAPEVDALVTENLQPTPREVPVIEQTEDDCTSDLEDEFDEEIDYEEEIIVEDSAHFEVVVDDDDDDDDNDDDNNSSEGEMMSDNSSTPPPSADFREPDEAMNDSLPGDQDSDEAADEADQEQSDAAEDDNEESNHDEDTSFPPSHIHIELPKQSQDEAIPLGVQEIGENATINDENEENSSSPKTPKSLDASLHQSDETDVVEINQASTVYGRSNSVSMDKAGACQDPPIIEKDLPTSDDSPLLFEEQPLGTRGEKVEEGVGAPLVDEDGSENIEGDPVPWRHVFEEKITEDAGKESHEVGLNLGKTMGSDTLVEHKKTVSEGDHQDTMETAVILGKLNSEESDGQILQANNDTRLDNHGNEDEPLVINDAVRATTHGTDEAIVDNSSAHDGFTKVNENRAKDSNAEDNTERQESSVENVQDSSVGVALPLHSESWRDDNKDDFNGGEVKSEINVDDLIGGDGSPVGPSIVFDDGGKRTDDGDNGGDEEVNDNIQEPTLDGAISLPAQSELEDEEPIGQGLESTDGDSTMVFVKEETVVDNSSNPLESSTKLEDSEVAHSDVNGPVSVLDNDEYVQEDATSTPILESSKVLDNKNVGEATNDHVPEVTDNVSELADVDRTTNLPVEATMIDSTVLVESTTQVLNSEEDLEGTTDLTEETMAAESSSAQLLEHSNVLDKERVDKATNDNVPEVTENALLKLVAGSDSTAFVGSTTPVLDSGDVEGTIDVKEETTTVTVNDSGALVDSTTKVAGSEEDVEGTIDVKEETTVAANDSTAIVEPTTKVLDCQEDVEGTIDVTEETATVTVHDSTALVESTTQVSDDEEDVEETVDVAEETTTLTANDSSALVESTTHVLDGDEGVKGTTNDAEASKGLVVSQAVESPLNSDHPNASEESDEEKTAPVSDLAVVQGTLQVQEDIPVKESTEILLESTEGLEETDSIQETDRGDGEGAPQEIENVAALSHDKVDNVADDHDSQEAGIPIMNALEEVGVADGAMDVTTLDDSTMAQVRDSSYQGLEEAGAKSDQGNDESAGDPTEEDIGRVVLQEVIVTIDE